MRRTLSILVFAAVAMVAGMITCAMSPSPPPSSPPAVPACPFVRITVQSSTNLVDWQTFYTVPNTPARNDQCLYRLKIEPVAQ